MSGGAALQVIAVVLMGLVGCCVVALLHATAAHRADSRDDRDGDLT